MSKLSFRARALDAAKPLPIYRNKDLPDLTDCVSINRAVPQMPTGMEKEEETVCEGFKMRVFHGVQMHRSVLVFTSCLRTVSCVVLFSACGGTVMGAERV